MGLAQTAVLAVCDLLKGRSGLFSGKRANFGRWDRAAASLRETADPQERGLRHPAKRTAHPSGLLDSRGITERNPGAIDCHSVMQALKT